MPVVLFQRGSSLIAFFLIEEQQMNLPPTSLNRPELTFMYTLLDYFRARLWPCYIYFAQKISWIVNWFGKDHFYLSLVHNSFPAYSTHDFHRDMSLYLVGFRPKSVIFLE